MFDLLLVGGTVVDPSRGLHAVRDIAVQDGRIAALAESLKHEPAKRVIALTGRFVTPGLIDLHTHVADGVPVRIASR